MVFHESNDPNDPGGSYGGPGTSGEPSGITDPGPARPTWQPGGNGWWEFINGVWHWMTEPKPRSV